MSKLKLLYRADKFLDESFFDYLSRLSYWNGFNSANVFKSALIKLYNKIYLDDKNQLFNIMKCHSALESVLKRNINYSQLNLFNYSLCHKGVIKICRCCWMKSKYIRFYWRMDGYSICHIHKTKLIVCSEGLYSHYFSSVNDSKVETDKMEHNQRVLNKAIEIYSLTDFALKKIESELDCNFYEKKIIIWLSHFLKMHMSRDVNISDALNLSDSGALVGLSIHNRMDKIINILSASNKWLENVIRIVAVLRVKQLPIQYDASGWTYYPAPGFDYWANIEGLSIDSLFYAYVGFGSLRHTMPARYQFRYEFEGFSFLESSIDRSLCVSLYNTSLYFPYDRNDVDLISYQELVKNRWPNPRSIKFNEYLKLIGKKSIDDLEN